MWINTHALSNPAFNISPFFAGSIYASPNAHDAFFFSFTEIVYQTHCISSFLCCFVITAWLDAPRPINVMPIQWSWKLLLARVSDFMSLSSKPLWQHQCGCTLQPCSSGSARGRQIICVVLATRRLVGAKINQAIHCDRKS